MESSSTGLNSKINIHPESDFENGLGLGLEVASGNDFDTKLNASPDYVKSAPVSFGVELKVQDEASGPAVVQGLESLLEMVSEMLPPVKEYLDKGVQIKFRGNGSSVFVDVVVDQALAQCVLCKVSNYKYDQMNSSGTINLSAHSGIKISDVVTGTPENLVQKATQFKVEGNANISNTKNLIQFFVSLLGPLLDQVPKKFRGLLMFLSAVRLTSYDFVYDSKLLAEIVRKVGLEAAGKKLGQSGEAATSQLVAAKASEYQTMGLEMLEQFKPMADSFLEPYKPMLQSVNFDQISLFAFFPQMKVYAKKTLDLKGITGFLREKVFN